MVPPEAGGGEGQLRSACGLPWVGMGGGREWSQADARPPTWLLGCSASERRKGAQSCVPVQQGEEPGGLGKQTWKKETEFIPNETLMETQVNSLDIFQGHLR